VTVLKRDGAWSRWYLLALGEGLIGGEFLGLGGTLSAYSWFDCG
jgi:hypothetical protein